MTANETVLKDDMPAPDRKATIDRLEVMLTQIRGLAAAVEVLGMNTDDDKIKAEAIYTLGWVMHDLADQAHGAVESMGNPA